QASNRDIRLAIDGGIKLDNIQEVAKAGADMFILGSGIFHEKSYPVILNALREELKKVHPQ
ncbi:MAG TPA: ribulose-phosphate 3-epimerase, partial [Gammaproteobacteria bacterium]|nr:ribulose-phosphate 3-epimerase [Gammaproteobacteria bacterium]